MSDTRNQRKSPIKRDLLVAIIALASGSGNGKRIWTWFSKGQAYRLERR